MNMGEQQLRFEALKAALHIRVENDINAEKLVTEAQIIYEWLVSGKNLSFIVDEQGKIKVFDPSREYIKQDD